MTPKKKEVAPEDLQAEYQQLREEMETRTAELAVLRAIQEGLAAGQDIDSIFELAGESIAKIFPGEGIALYTYDPETHWGEAKYILEDGVRHYPPPFESGPIGKKAAKTKQPIVISNKAEYEAIGATIIEGTAPSLSGIYTPLIVHNRPVGALNIESTTRENAFDEGDIRLVTTIAGSLSVALENARLYDETQQRASELAIINSVQEALASKLEMEAIYDLVGSRVQEIFDAQVVVISRFDRSTKLNHYEFAIEKGERLSIPPQAFNTITEDFIAAKETLLMNDGVAKWMEAGGASVVAGEQPLSVLSVPLIQDDQVSGAVSLQNVSKENAFDPADVQLLETLAASLSVALENARLFDEVQRSNLELSEALETQTATSEIMQVMAASQAEIQPVLDSVAQNAARLCEADDVQIYQVMENALYQVAHFGPLPGLKDGESLPLVPGLITGRAVLNRETIHIEDTAAISKKEYPESVKLQKRLKHRTTIATPLVQEGDAIGAIVVRRNRVKPFSNKQVAILSTFAYQAAIAIENVRLFNETTRLLKETEERNAELAIINRVQTALATKLDMQTIFELVGDQVHEVFPEAQVVDILSYDPETELFHPRYVIERGQRYEVDPWLARGFRKHVVETGQSLVINTDMEEKAKEYDNDWVIVGEESKSWVGVPMKVGDQVTGVISLQHIDRENAFSESNVRLLRTLANSMSVALENARLFKETEERNTELAIINTVQRALAEHLDIQGVYEAVGEKLREIFDTQIIAIYTVDLESKIITTAYAYEKGRRFEPDSIPFSSLHDHLIGLNDTYVFNGDFPEFAAKFKDYRVSAGELPKSLVGVPVGRKRGAKNIISLTLQDINGEKVFSPSEVRLLETLANSMSVALDNARLFDETQRLLKETEQRAAELQIINSVQEGLASKLEMQDIYDLVGDKIRETFKADTAYIAFHDIERNLIAVPYYTEKGVRHVLTDRPYGQGLAEIMIETGEPLLLHTYQEITGAGAYVVASPGSDQDLNESFLGVPIFRNGKAIGATSVQSYEQYAYDENDLSLLQTLTNTMIVAIENARLFNETQRLLQETEQRAGELAVMNTVSQAMVAESELEALIHLMGEQMRETFEADIVYIALLDPDRNMINFPYTYGEEFTPIAYGEGLTSKIIQRGEPLLINKDMDKRRAEMGVTRVGIGASSYLGVPIQMGEQTFGVISVQSTSEEGRFDQSDLRLLSTIAANVSAALRNAQLFDEIKRRKEYYEAIIENSPAAIVILNLEATVTGWNPAAEKLFGYTESEALGQNIDDLVASSDELHDEAVRYSQRALVEKQVHLIARRTRKDGSLVEVEVSGLPVFVDGKHVAFIAIYHDVTELQRARQEAEQANQAKSTFLANMSHELRTPLNAIIGFSRIVRRKGEGLLPEKQIENLEHVLVSAEHLLGLINTVLDISKIEAGRVDVKPTNFALPPLVEFAVDTSQPLLRDGVSLRTDLKADMPDLYSDEDKLKQILLNLISNAAKFTHEGEIILASGFDEERFYIDVSDTGIGVSEDSLPRIFEDFQQADTSTTREYGGTGLGLPISRSLARLLGGDLTACSIEGEGSIFTLSLPLRYSESKHGKAEIGAEVGG